MTEVLNSPPPFPFCLSPHPAEKSRKISQAWGEQIKVATVKLCICLALSSHDFFWNCVVPEDMSIPLPWFLFFSFPRLPFLLEIPGLFHTLIYVKMFLLLRFPCPLGIPNTSQHRWSLGLSHNHAPDEPIDHLHSRLNPRKIIGNSKREGLSKAKIFKVKEINWNI